jgi:hypothetical protein
VFSLLLVLVPSWSPVAATPTGLTGIAGNQSVALSWTLPDGTGFPISFNGTTYNEVFVGSNSYLTFGGGSTTYTGLGASNPGYPSIHICAGDWSYQTVQFRIDNSVTPNQLRIRYQGTAATSGGTTPNMIYEAVFFRNMSYFDLLVGTYSACSYSSSKLLTNGSSLSTPVSFAANSNWRITGLSASLNGNSSTWLGSSNASVTANSNGWTALTTAGADDSFVSSAQLPTYAVQTSSNGGTSWSNSVYTNSTATSYTYRSLLNGTPYVFRVAPYYSSSATTGQWSSLSPAYTPAIVPPGQPTSLVATSGNQQATLSWVAPSSVGDSAIVGYGIEYSTNGGVSWSTATTNTYSTSTTRTVTGLTNGTSYSFKVAAVNASSTGSYSTTASAIPAIVPPGQPTSLVATPGNQQASLSWVAPSSVGDSSIAGYRIEYSSNGGVSWLTATSNTYSTATSRTVTGLTNGTSYSFKVAAVNASSTGSFSTTISTVPRDPDLPVAPRTLTASRGDGQTVLQWSSVSSRYQSGYRIEYSTNSGSTWWTVNSNTYSTTTTRTITGLSNGTSYMFRVAAVDYYSGRGDFASVTVVPSRSASTSQNKSTTTKSKTKYVSKSFESANVRLSLSSVMKSAKIGVSGMRSISGSVDSYFGEPCRVSGKNVLRGDRESSCVVRVTMKKTDGSTLVATVTIRGSARTKG